MHPRFQSLLRFLYSPTFIVFVVAFLASLFVSWFNFSTYRIWNFYLAWQTQVVQSYAEMRQPTVPMIADNYKALGNHFSPILALAAPFYALFPQSFTLNVLMAFCFALAAAILAHSAQKLLSRKTAYVVGIGLALSWGFITGSAAGFHEYALAAPILAFALAKFLEQRWLVSSLAAGLLVFVKEDVGLILIFLGVVMAWRAKSWVWLWLSVWGAAWVYLTIKVIIPAISGQWEFSSFVSVDGKTLFTDANFKVVLLQFLILQGGIIAMRSPLAYIIIPFLGARLFTAWNAFYILGYHYDILTVIVMAFALLDALHRYEWKVSMRRLALALPIITTAVFLTIPTPGNLTSWVTRDYSKDQAVIQAYDELYRTIPKGSTVASDDSAIAGFLDRGYETYFIRSENEGRSPDCLVNPTDELTSANNDTIGTIEDLGERFNRDYKPVFDSEYIKAWCATDEENS
jgi:uncharacterized membrane protein